jgi:transcriptional regulator with XRE-family HTH domain
MKSTQNNATQWKQLREKSRLTQREVSDALGYSTPQFISNVERGRCRFPVQKLPKIQKLYRLSVNQMIELVLTEERQLLKKVFKHATR